VWQDIPPTHPLYYCQLLDDDLELVDLDYDDDKDQANPFICHIPGRDTDLTDSELPDHLQDLYETTVEQTRLSSDIKKELKDLLCEYSDVFATSNTDLGYCDILQHEIDTGDAMRIKQSPCRPPLAATGAEDEILDDMLSSGVIEPSNSP